jgi:hypothetical protein
MYQLNNNCSNTMYNMSDVTNIYHEKILNYKRIFRAINHVFDKSGLCHSLHVQYLKKTAHIKLLQTLNRKGWLNVVKQCLIINT